MRASGVAAGANAARARARRGERHAASFALLDARVSRAVSTTSFLRRPPASSRCATAASSSATRSRARRSTARRRPRTGVRRTARSPTRCPTATPTAAPGTSRSRPSARTTRRRRRSSRPARARASGARTPSRQPRSSARRACRWIRAPLLHEAADAAWLAGHADRAVALLDERGPSRTTTHSTSGSSTCAARSGPRRGPVQEAQSILAAAAERAEAIDLDAAAVMHAEATIQSFYAGDAAAMLRSGERAIELATQTGGRASIFAELAHGMALVFAGEGERGARRDSPRRGRARAVGRPSRGSVPRRLGGARAALAAGVGGGAESVRARGRAGPQPNGARCAAGAARARRARLGDDGRMGGGARRVRREHRARARDRSGSRRSRSLSPASRGSRRGRVARRRRGRTLPRDARPASGPASSCTSCGRSRRWATSSSRSAGRRTALAHYEEWDALLRSRGIEDADLSPCPELVETYLRLGRVDDARASAARHDESARAKGQPWALARAARTRGLLASDDELETVFDGALELHDSTPDVFETARTRLAYGSRLRRAGRRVRAREELRRAIELLDALGAAPWSDIARTRARGDRRDRT